MDARELVPTHKTCTRCGRLLPLDEFHVGSGLYGRKSACKECVNAANTAKRRAKEQTIPDRKRCPTCGRFLPASAFKRDRSTDDWLGRECRECDARRKAADGRPRRMAPEPEPCKDSILPAMRARRAKETEEVPYEW